MIELACVPVSVETYTTHRAVGVLRAHLGDGEAATGTVLTDNNRHRPRIDGIITFRLYRGLRRKHVFRCLVVHDLERDVGIAVIHQSNMLEHIQIKILDVTRRITR